MKIPASTIAIGVLLIIVIIYMQCGKKKDIDKPQTTTTIKIDTVLLPQETITIHDTPKIATSKPKPIPQSMKPSENYDSLKAQYEIVTKELFAQNTYHDTIKNGNKRYAVIDDTIQQNNIFGRGVLFSMRPEIIEKTVTNTTIIPQQARREVYLGTGISSMDYFTGIALHAGALYKNRKKNITELNVGINNTGNVIWGANTYWLLSFRKKE